MRLNKKKENRQLSAGFVVLENPFSLNLVAHQEEQGIYNCLQYGLAKDSVVLLEQIRTIDKKRLKERMGELDNMSMHKVDDALSITFGLNNLM